MNVVQLNIQILQASAAVALRWGGRFYSPFYCSYLKVQQWNNY